MTVELVIEPPDRTFEGLFAKRIDGEEAAMKKRPKGKEVMTNTTMDKVPGTGKPQGSASSYAELNISSITKKGFYSGSSKIKPDEVIKPTGDDVIELEIEVEDKRAAIHGVVKFPNGKPVHGALVKLFRKDGRCESHCDMIPVTFAFICKSMCKGYKITGA